MMSVVIRISTGNDDGLRRELMAEAGMAGIDVTLSSTTRGALPEILVALGSAGVFTALYQVICQLLQKNKGRELSVERKGVRLVLKGHSLPEEKEMVEALVPELLGDRNDKHDLREKRRM